LATETFSVANLPDPNLTQWEDPPRIKDNSLFFFRDLISNEDAEACRALIFARAASLGVVCE